MSYPRLRITKDGWYRVGREFILYREGLDEGDLKRIPKLVQLYQKLDVPLKYSTLVDNRRWFESLDARPIDGLFPLLFYAPLVCETEDGKVILLRESPYSFLKTTDGFFYVIPTLYVNLVKSEIVKRTLDWKDYLYHVRKHFTEEEDRIADLLEKLKGWRR